MRLMMMTVVFLLLLGLFPCAQSLASVPPMINYQGKLMQPSGVPVPDGTYSMTFAIYAAPTGGTALWSETNSSVQVKGGLFSVLLGSVINLPTNIFDSPDRWFGVTVGADPEMTPRQRIASVAYASQATTAETAMSVADGAVTTGKIADGAVTDTKLATISTAGKVSGAAITSLSSIPTDAGVLPIVNGGTGSATQNFVGLLGDQTVAGVKTFSSFPVTPSSAPTMDYQTANKKYVDGNAPVQVGLGSWVTNSVHDTVYQAATDLFVSAWTDGGWGLGVFIYSGASSAGVTSAVDDDTTYLKAKNYYYTANGMGSGIGASCFVRKNDYWKVHYVNSTDHIYVIPLGN